MMPSTVSNLPPWRPAPRLACALCSDRATLYWRTVWFNSMSDRGLRFEDMVDGYSCDQCMEEIGVRFSNMLSTTVQSQPIQWTWPMWWSAKVTQPRALRRRSKGGSMSTRIRFAVDDWRHRNDPPFEPSLLPPESGEKTFVQLEPGEEFEYEDEDG